MSLRLKTIYSLLKNQNHSVSSKDMPSHVPKQSSKCMRVQRHCYLPVCVPFSFTTNIITDTSSNLQPELPPHTTLRLPSSTKLYVCVSSLTYPLLDISLSASSSSYTNLIQMWANPSSQQTPAPQNLTRHIQALVREARCYPPEREPRIVRDLYDCCRHFSGLVPKLEYCVIDSNQTIRLIALDGVIPVTYRSVTYHIPVGIWCRPHYPNDAPVPYVRPTNGMVLRERHSHLDKEGRVYLPHYLSVWDPTQSNMYGVVVAMIRVFEVEPPVNSRRNLPNRAAEQPERLQLIAALSKRITYRLHDANEEAVVEICQLLERRDCLAETDKHATEELRHRAQRHKLLDEILRQATAKKDELEQWIHSHDHKPEDTEEKDVDDLVQCRNMWDHQIIECTAEDHAHSDALDQIDEAFVKGVIDQDTYMKDIRSISRDQFVPRALRKKIEVGRAKEAHADQEGKPKRVTSASRGYPLLFASST